MNRILVIYESYLVIKTYSKKQFQLINKSFINLDGSTNLPLKKLSINLNLLNAEKET